MTTHFTAGGERAIVSIRGGVGDEFNVYLPKGGTPANLASVLAAVNPRVSRVAFEAGVVAADFVASVSPKVRCQLVASPAAAVSRFFPQADLRLAVSHDRPRAQVEVKLFRIVGGTEEAAPLFAGTVAAFTDWAAKLTGLESIVKKTVRFKYNGGSRPGQNRLVRVEEVERDGNVVRVKGHDLEKPDLKLAYRCYTSDRIEGDIAVLN